MLSKFAKVFEGKSDAYKQLIYIMLRVHFQSELVFSIVETEIYFVDIVVKNKSNVF